MARSLMPKLWLNHAVMHRYRKVDVGAGLVFRAIVDLAEQSAEPGVLRRGRDYDDVADLCGAIVRSNPGDVDQVRSALERLGNAGLLVLEEDAIALPTGGTASSRRAEASRRNGAKGGRPPGLGKASQANSGPDLPLPTRLHPLRSRDETELMRMPAAAAWPPGAPRDPSGETHGETQTETQGGTQEETQTETQEKPSLAAAAALSESTSTEETRGYAGGANPAETQDKTRGKTQEETQDKTQTQTYGETQRPTAEPDAAQLATARQVAGEMVRAFGWSGPAAADAPACVVGWFRAGATVEQVRSVLRVKGAAHANMQKRGRPKGIGHPSYLEFAVNEAIAAARVHGEPPLPASASASATARQRHADDPRIQGSPRLRALSGEDREWAVRLLDALDGPDAEFARKVDFVRKAARHVYDLVEEIRPELRQRVDRINDEIVARRYPTAQAV